MAPQSKLQPPEFLVTRLCTRKSLGRIDLTDEGIATRIGIPEASVVRLTAALRKAFDRGDISTVLNMQNEAPRLQYAIEVTKVIRTTFSANELHTMYVRNPNPELVGYIFYQLGMKHRKTFRRRDLRMGFDRVTNPSS